VQVYETDILTAPLASGETAVTTVNLSWKAPRNFRLFVDEMIIGLFDIEVLDPESTPTSPGSDRTIVTYKVRVTRKDLGTANLVRFGARLRVDTDEEGPPTPPIPRDPVDFYGHTRATMFYEPEAPQTDTGPAPEA
jgi:hypothetical protein